MTQIDRNVIRRFISLALPFFRSEARWKAIGLFALLLGLILTNNGISVMMSYIFAAVMTALQTKNQELFYNKLLLYVGAFFIATPDAVFYNYTEQRSEEHTSELQSH